MSLTLKMVTDEASSFLLFQASLGAVQPSDVFVGQGCFAPAEIGNAMPFHLFIRNCASADRFGHTVVFASMEQHQIVCSAGISLNTLVSGSSLFRGTTVS